MRLYYDGFQILDLLNSYLFENNKELIDALQDEDLNSLIKNIDENIRFEYFQVLGLIKDREILNLLLKDYPEEQINSKVEVPQLLQTFYYEFPFEERINYVNIGLKKESIKQLISIIEDLVNSLKELFLEIENKFKSDDFLPDELLDFYNKCLRHSVVFVLASSELGKKIISEYEKWKLSPELKLKFAELYNDNFIGLEDEKRYKTNDPIVFFKQIFKLDKYRNLKFPDVIPFPDFDDLIHYDNIRRKRGKEIDKVYESNKVKSNFTESYIIDLPIIDRLYEKYGKFMKESRDSWRERFVNIDSKLKVPETIETSCRKGNNLHLLITILSVIDERLLTQKVNGKPVKDFEIYVLNRWGIKGFRDLKSRRYKNHVWIHTQKSEIEKMI